MVVRRSWSQLLARLAWRGASGIGGERRGLRERHCGVVPASLTVGASGAFGVGEFSILRVGSQALKVLVQSLWQVWKR